jgi:hypothetical protein
MNYFLRFTDNPNSDLERGTSIHASDDGENTILDGLCGYLLEAESLEEAIEEAKDGQWQFDFVGTPVIFKGKYSQESNLVPDGDLFIPISIEAVLA